MSKGRVLDSTRVRKVDNDKGIARKTHLRTRIVPDTLKQRRIHGEAPSAVVAVEKQPPFPASWPDTRHIEVRHRYREA